jgi:hypothetical protein
VIREPCFSAARKYAYDHCSSHQSGQFLSLKIKYILYGNKDHSDYESTTTNRGALAAKKKLLTPPKRVKILPQGHKRFNTATPVGFASALRDVLS